jgi:hypothetical protein
VRLRLGRGWGGAGVGAAVRSRGLGSNSVRWRTKLVFGRELVGLGWCGVAFYG